MKKYNMAPYYAALQDMQKYSVGKTFYMIKENRIKEVFMYRITLRYHDPFPQKTESDSLTVNLVLEALIENNIFSVRKEDLFETREEAAEFFLDENEIPKKLLEVLKPEKSKTTVADLISKLQELNPELDLESDFWKVLTPVTRRMLPIELNDEYGDCECPEYYIHPKEHQFCEVCGAEKQFCPSSRADEICVENMTKQKE